MEDNQIVQLYWDRNENAIKYTEEKYGNYCKSIAKNIVGNFEDAEECVNDTYINAWNAMPPHKPSILAAFLGKITRNISFNRYKRNKAEKRGNGEMDLILDELSECTAGTNDTEKEIEYQELIKAINEFLVSLSEYKRNIFVCRYWYSDSISSIAKAYGVKENAVSMALGRLRKKLRAYLLERGFEV